MRQGRRRADRRDRNWDLAEDCAQEAFGQALRTWPEPGVPGRPGAWLTTAARNQAVDRLWRGVTEAEKLRQCALLTAPPSADGGDIPDERLALIFACCHPVLPVEAQVALALRTLSGRTVAEVAHAFLSPKPP